MFNDKLLVNKYILNKHFGLWLFFLFLMLASFYWKGSQLGGFSFDNHGANIDCISYLSKMTIYSHQPQCRMPPVIYVLHFFWRLISPELYTLGPLLTVFVMNILLLWLLLKIIRQEFGDIFWYKFLAGVMYVGWLFPIGMNYMDSGLMLFFFVFGSYFLLYKNTRFYYVASGLLYVLALFSKQIVLFPIILMFFLIGLKEWFKNRSLSKVLGNLCWSVVPFAVITVIIFLFFNNLLFYSFLTYSFSRASASGGPQTIGEARDWFGVFKMMFFPASHLLQYIYLLAIFIVSLIGFRKYWLFSLLVFLSLVFNNLYVLRSSLEYPYLNILYRYELHVLFFGIILFVYAIDKLYRKKTFVSLLIISFLLLIILIPLVREIHLVTLKRLVQYPLNHMPRQNLLLEGHGIFREGVIDKVLVKQFEGVEPGWINAMVALGIVNKTFLDNRVLHNITEFSEILKSGNITVVAWHPNGGDQIIQLFNVPPNDYRDYCWDGVVKLDYFNSQIIQIIKVGFLNKKDCVDFSQLKNEWYNSISDLICFLSPHVGNMVLMSIDVDNYNTHIGNVFFKIVNDYDKISDGTLVTDIIDKYGKKYHAIVILGSTINDNKKCKPGREFLDVYGSESLWFYDGVLFVIILVILLISSFIIVNKHH